MSESNHSDSISSPSENDLEARLQESDTRWRALFGSFPLPSYWWRKKGEDIVLEDFNQAAMAATDGAIQKLKGQTAQQIYFDSPEIEQKIHCCLNERRCLQETMHYRLRSTGVERELNVTFVYVPGDSVIVHAEDISARVQAEIALRATEERFSKAFHANPAAIVISHAETGEIIDANDAFFQFYGFERQEAIGRNSSDLGIWSEPGERARLIRQLEAEGKLRNAEAQILTRRGELRYVSISTDYLELSRRKVILSILVDITDRKRTEEQLRYNEELNRRIIEGVSGGVVLVTPDGAIRDANAEGQRLLGLTYDKLTRTYVSDFAGKTIFEDGSPCEVKDYPVSKCLTTQQPQPRTIIGVLKPDGDWIWGIFAALPVFDHVTREFCGAVVTFVDITARKKVEEALRESETRYRTLAESTGVGIWQVKRAGET
ncbi:MAG TPA: PAS domain S-box protein, partial [Verrucomicrobiae bacterium]